MSEPETDFARTLVERFASVDPAGVDPRWRRLLFHDLLARGYYIAERGYLALSLAVTEQHLTGFVAAARAFADEYADLAAARTADAPRAASRPMSMYDVVDRG